MVKRYLLQTKKTKSGEIKQFVFAWTPVLADKKGMFEISAESAKAVMLGETIPADSLPNNILNDEKFVSIHIKKELLSDVLFFIETLEKQKMPTIPATAEFPEVTIKEEETITLVADGSTDVSVLKREINSIKSKNGLENYIEENKLDLDIPRTVSLYEMKQLIIEKMLEKR